MILGVESSCDESALALFDPLRGMQGEWVSSQVEMHRTYGGVVPDLAAREHLRNFPLLLDSSEVMEQADRIQRIVVTEGPGLAGCLALGIGFAKSVGMAIDRPVVGGNHLVGHAWSPFIALHEADPDEFQRQLEAKLPHLGLIVSGGNTILFSIDRCRCMEVLAETVDDAAGEALDKGAKLLGLPYPGGPEIETLAARGNAAAFDFPKAIAPRNEKRFSFSGLKTSLRYRLEKMDDRELAEALPDLCAAYQGAVIGQLTAKTRHLLEAGAYRSLGLSGGVSNNRAVRAAMEHLAGRFGVACNIARPAHTGDNAGMIAFADCVEFGAADGGEPRTGPVLQPALRLA